GGVVHTRPPSDRASQTKSSEDRRVVLADASRQHLRLPHIRRGFEALQLSENLERPALARELRAWRHVLPPELPAHEIGRGHRRDFATQLAERHAMNAREQSPF